MKTWWKEYAAVLMIFGVSVAMGFGSSKVWASVPKGSVLGNPTKPTSKVTAKLVDRLTDLRYQVLTVGQNLLEGLKSKRQAESHVHKIQLLLKLQKEERKLGLQRLSELENTIKELESRRKDLSEKILAQRKKVHHLLVSVERVRHNSQIPLHSKTTWKVEERETSQAARRHVIARLAQLSVQEVEALSVDLADADKLENQIQEEKQQLVYLFQDLNEQESVLEFNRKFQADLVKKQHQARLEQMENYRKLKAAESQVESLLSEFNARKELEQNIQSERAANRAMREMMQGAFGRQKGSLPLPVAEGKITGSFGRFFDPEAKLHVFKKGLDIVSSPQAPVTAVFAGKIAFSGELPNYGRVVIIDHGDHFYSLCAHLGELRRKQGEVVMTGDLLGLTDERGGGVYFEIRARNVAVNPLQWISKSFTF